MRYRFDEIAYNSTAKKKPTEDDKETYIGLEHLDSECLTISRWGSEVAPVGEKLIMKKGDILFGKRRAYQRKVGIAPFDGIFSAHGMVLRPNEEVINPNFFPFFISSDQFMERAVRISVGGLSPTINWKDLREQEFDIPSLDEQKELADKLWAAYNLKESYKKLLSATDEMVKSQFIEMFDKVKDNKYGYMSYRLSDCCSFISDGSHYSPKEAPNGQYPMLSVKDMTEKGFTYKDCKYISKEEYDKLVANGCKPEINDVLVAKDGSYFKYSFALIEAREQAVLSSIAILRPNPAIVDSRYLAYYMLTPEVIRLVEQNYLTGTAIKRVRLKGFKEIPVLTPPLDKQQKFVSILQQADKSKFIEMFEGDKYPKTRLGDFVSIRTEKLDANASSENGKSPFFTCGVETLKIDDYAFDCEAVLHAGNGEFCVKYYNGKFNAYQRTYVIETLDKNVISVPYLYAWFGQYAKVLRGKAIGGIIKYIKMGDLTEAKISFPPLEVQNSYVAIAQQADKSGSGLRKSIESIDKVIKV